MLKRWITLAAVLALAVPFTSFFTVREAEGAASGNYPGNYNMQDYEPSADEQWDLDVVSSDDGRFFAVWADDRDLYSDIRFSKSQNGTSWGDGEFNNNDIIVNSDSGEGLEHWSPSIAADDRPRLYCIWLDNGGDGTRMMISTSNTSGNLWTPARQITGITGKISEPEMVWSPVSGLVIVYVLEHERTPGSGMEKDIMYAFSTNEGESFSTPSRLNDDDSGEDQIHPALSVSRTGRIAVAWEDYRNGDSVTGRNSDIYISYTRSGLLFIEDIKAGRDSEDDKQQIPDIGFSWGGDILVTWQESTLNGWRVKYSFAWSGSSEWDMNITNDHSATMENATTNDQFRPKVDYINGAFSLAWTEVDIRDFYLVRCGYLTGDGKFVKGNHIVDNSIDLGTFVNDPDIYISEMYRETVSVIGSGSGTQVFWLDHRTDNNPSNDLNEDSDPYTATAIPDPTIPGSPEPVRAFASSVSWGEATIGWDISTDIDLKGYYLTIAEGDDAPYPDANVNNGSVTDRTVNRFTFKDLVPETNHSIRFVTIDRFGNRADSNIIRFRTGSNSYPLFNFLEPDGDDDTSDTGITISWECSDEEEIAQFEIYYDTDLDPEGQVFLYSGNSAQGNGFGEFFWNTTGIPAGGYTLNASITDGVNDPVIVYSPAIIVSHRTIIRDLPRVLSVNVEGGISTAFADSDLSVTFTKDVSAVSIDQDTLYVLGPDNIRVGGIISLSGEDTVIWNPTELMKFGSEYDLILKPGITDLQGNELDGANIGEPSTYTFSFNTRSDAGTPQIRSWSPQGSGAPMRPTLTASFDIPILATTMTEENAVLLSPSGRSIPLSISTDGNGLDVSMLTLEPLLQETEYTVNLKTSITSQKGVRLERQFNWSFTTGLPDMSKDRDNDSTPDDLDWFPDDPSESRDTDRDSIGDTADLDDDGDGMLDEWEEKYDLDPLDPDDASLDNDGDGKTNLEEYRERTDPNGEEKEEKNNLIIYVSVIVICAIIILALVIYAVVLRKNIREQEEQRSFFREE